LTPLDPASSAQADSAFAPEFIVVGSGAGGGTVAARLAESGFRVLVLEAGGDPRTLSGANPLSAGANTLPADYDVPAFHTLSTENEAMRWDFFVRHYGNQTQQEEDPNYCASQDPTRDGVLYPRAGTLGGCTAHNALIFVAPTDPDWNLIADLTGDPSWRADAMWSYFERVEHRLYRRFLGESDKNGGWLGVERAIPRAAVRDQDLRHAVIESARAALDAISGRLQYRPHLDEVDPNDRKVVQESRAGLRFTPLTTRGHARNGTRERLLDVQARFPDRLKIELNALATRVIFEGTRAVGVEYLKGERLYGACATPGGPGVLHEARASREVILAGGAFNTPQLLMLSGIGPAAELEPHKITVVVDLPGVGTNLQDRYEVAVVNRMAFDSWDVLRGATYTSSDPQYREWKEKKDGVYTTNGAILSVVLPAGPGRPVPDLFCYAVIAKFTGYKPGYTRDLPENPNCLTWVVLKGHTNNTAGSVTLRSKNPLDPPVINFRYFEEGSDGAKQDLQSVVEGIKFVRLLAADLRKEGRIKGEEMPGDDCTSDADLERFVRNHAWGHHASCTCPIGKEPDGVLTSDFKVHGTEGLRVVDASVFPRVPGLFIASAVYMIGEKAADVIAAQARS